MGTKVLSPVIKRPGSEADHSLPKFAEFKNSGVNTSTLPYVFMVCH
jgi:hypothetical protein